MVALQSETRIQWIHSSIHLGTLCALPTQAIIQRKLFLLRYLFILDIIDRPFSPEAVAAVLPVDIYVGGVEHAILHLLYARFISKFLFSTSMWPSGGGASNQGEPFMRLITQGMVHGKTYTDPTTGRFLLPAEVDFTDLARPKVLATGETARCTYEKMSKSKHNGVDPQECITRHGADATRAHILFQAPVTEVLEWDEDRIVGIHRWLNRVWRVMSENQGVDAMNAINFQLPSTLSEAQADLWAEVQTTIADVSTSLDKSYTLNTVVSSLIKLTNKLASCSPLAVTPEMYRAATCVLLKMMAPVTPAFAEECWSILHHSETADTSIFDQPWPKLDETYPQSTAARQQACAVQINGKLRFVTTIPRPPVSKDSESQANIDLRDWIVDKILRTEQAKKWFGKPNGRLSIDDAKKIVVARGGQTVNFVFSNK